MLKRIILIVALIPMLISISNAQCPTPASAWDGPYTITYQFGPDCYVEAEYCFFTGITITGTPDIHFGKFIITGSCSSIAWSSNGPLIPWNELIGKIITDHSRSSSDPQNSGYTQFENLDIPHCDDNPISRPVIKITSGGCYDYFYDALNERHIWTPCSADGQEECHQSYQLCRYFDDEIGGMRIRVVSGPNSPAFSCPDENCSPICNQTDDGE